MKFNALLGIFNLSSYYCIYLGILLISSLTLGSVWY